MKILVQQLSMLAKQDRITLGEVLLTTDRENSPDEWSGVSRLTLLCGRTVDIFGAYARFNQRFSLTMMFEGRYIFVATCHWNEVAPFFGIELNDGSFLEVHCSR